MPVIPVVINKPSKFFQLIAISLNMDFADILVFPSTHIFSMRRASIDSLFT